MAAKNVPSALEQLGPKYQEFVVRYLLHGNGARAATEAKFVKNPASARSISRNILRNKKVRAALSEETTALRDKYHLTVERIMQELGYIALSDIGDAYNPDGTQKDISEIPEALRRAISSVSVEEQMALFAKKDDPQSELKKIRLHDKVRALHLAGLQLKMFKEGRDLGLLDDLADLIRQARERSGAGAK